MPLTQPQLRPKPRPPVGAAPMLLALLLALLQMATPFAHAMLHVSGTAEASRAWSVQHEGPAWTGTAPEEKPCALCAADHLPALPETAFVPAPISSTRALTPTLPVLSLSSAPLDLFCRPPPSA